MASVPDVTYMSSTWHSMMTEVQSSEVMVCKTLSKRSSRGLSSKIGSFWKEGAFLFVLKFLNPWNQGGDYGLPLPPTVFTPSEFSVSLGLFPQWGKLQGRGAASKQMRPLIYHKKEDWLLRFYWITIKAPSTRSLWFDSRHHWGSLKS